MFCIVLGALSTSTHATVESFVSANGPQYSYQSDAVSVEDQQTIGLSTAYAYGNVSLGVLRARASNGPLSSGTSFSQVQFYEYVTFNAGANGIGYLDWVFSAKVSPGIAGNQPLGPAQVALHTQVDSIVENHLLTNGFCPVGYTSCASERGGTTSYTKTGSIAFNIAPGPFYISTKLSGAATDNSNVLALAAWMDASNTGRFFLRLPDDVSYTSESGSFLVNASPVPELGTGILSLCGALSLLSLYRRNTRRQCSRLCDRVTIFPTLE